MCVHAHTCMHSLVHACAYGEQRSMPCVFLNPSPACFLKQGVSVNLELASFVTLTAQQALLISESLPLNCHNYRRKPLCLHFSESVGDLNSAIHACMTGASSTGKTFCSINSVFESYHCKISGLFEKGIL